jgi:hypothetical protein
MPLRTEPPAGAAIGSVLPPAETTDAGELPPPGQRSGEGVRTVLPYLARTLKARPTSAHDVVAATGKEAPAASKFAGAPGEPPTANP